jgi:hypothetical protein
MRWRSGSSSRSSCSRRSSLARSLAVRSSYSLRLAPSDFALGLQLQRVLQARLRGGVGQARQLGVGPLVFVGQAGGLLGGGLDGALQLAAARVQRALRELRFLRLALQAALLLARLRQLALGLDHALVELRMPLLAVGQLHVEFFEAAFGGDAALLQFLQQRVDLGQVAGDLLAAGPGLLGQLRQAQRLDLQFVRAALRFGGFAAPPPGAARRRCRRLRRAPAPTGPPR